jgi:hypothetical protein
MKIVFTGWLWLITLLTLLTLSLSIPSSSKFALGRYFDFFLLEKR